MLRVIHPNRWFFWTIAALIVAGFGTMVLIQKALLEKYNRAFSYL